MQVVEPINRLLDTVPFHMHCYSLDWHPSDHVSFIDNCHLRKLHEESKGRNFLIFNYFNYLFPLLYRSKVLIGVLSMTQLYLKVHQKWSRHCGLVIVYKSLGALSYIKI